MPNFKVVEDEQHFLFECPACSHVRIRHRSLFEHEHASVASILNTIQHSLLGRYLSRFPSISGNAIFNRKYVLRSPTIEISRCFRAWAQQAWLSHAVEKYCLKLTLSVWPPAGCDISEQTSRQKMQRSTRGCGRQRFVPGGITAGA